MHILKISVKSTPRKIRRWRAPPTGIRRAICDVSGDVLAGPVPDLDGARCPEGGVDAAADGVEGCAVGSSDVIGDCAAVVAAAAAAGGVAD